MTRHTWVTRECALSCLSSQSCVVTLIPCTHRTAQDVWVFVSSHPCMEWAFLPTSLISSSLSSSSHSSLTSSSSSTLQFRRGLSSANPVLFRQGDGVNWRVLLQHMSTESSLLWSHSKQWSLPSKRWLTSSNLILLPYAWQCCLPLKRVGETYGFCRVTDYPSRWYFFLQQSGVWSRVKLTLTWMWPISFLFAIRFGAGQWSFLGRGSEQKWYSISEDGPQSEWDEMAVKMMVTFVENTQSSEPRIHYSEECLRTKVVENCRYTSALMSERLNNFSHNYFCKSAQSSRSSRRKVWRIWILSR